MLRIACVPDGVTPSASLSFGGGGGWGLDLTGNIIQGVHCPCGSDSSHVNALQPCCTLQIFFLHGKELFSSKQVLNNRWRRDALFWLDCFFDIGKRKL